MVETCAGGRVTTNDFMRNLDLGQPDVVDGRKLEVIVDGLPLYCGAQVAVDTTSVLSTKTAHRVVLHNRMVSSPSEERRRARSKLVVLVSVGQS